MNEPNKECNAKYIPPHLRMFERRNENNAPPHQFSFPPPPRHDLNENFQRRGTSGKSESFAPWGMPFHQGYAALNPPAGSIAPYYPTPWIIPSLYQNSFRPGCFVFFF